MDDIAELRRLFSKALRRDKVQTHYPGSLGLPQEDGSYQFSVDGWPGYVWVRLGIGDEQVTVIKAINTGAALIPDLPVWVTENLEGHLEIVSTRASEFIQMTGGNITGAAVAPHTHEPGGGMIDPVNEKRILPGMGHVDVGMNIYVQPFTYYYNAELKFWPGGTIDLTTYVPDVPMQRWVLISINPATNTLMAQPGEELSGFMELSLNDLLSLFDGDARKSLPLVGVKVHAEQTIIGDSNDIVSVRTWWGSTGLSPLTLARHNLTATANPTAADDVVLGYLAGSVWINVSNDKVFICIDSSEEAADWQQISGSGEGGGASVLDDLEDVDTSTVPPEDGQALVWQESSELWIPGDVSGAGEDYSGVRVYTEENLSCGEYQTVKIPWTAELWDTDSYHDNSTNNTRLTIPANGTYSITAFLRWTTPVIGRMRVIKNGTVIVFENFSYADLEYAFSYNFIIGELQLAAGDYLEINFSNQSSGTKSVAYGQYVTYAIVSKR